MASLLLLDRQGFGFSISVKNRAAIAWPVQINVEANPGQSASAASVLSIGFCDRVGQFDGVVTRSAGVVGLVNHVGLNEYHVVFPWVIGPDEIQSCGRLSTRQVTVGEHRVDRASATVVPDDVQVV